MDKLFEDDIKLFCVDVELNHFEGLEMRQRKHMQNISHFPHLQYYT